MRVATCGLGTRRCARVASAGAMKISGLTVIVTCERVINLSPNAGRFALVEPIVGAMRQPSRTRGRGRRRPKPSPRAPRTPGAVGAISETGSVHASREQIRKRDQN